jgi:dTDP-4-amino-4,6-dideoxygalactose transaminase
MGLTFERKHDMKVPFVDLSALHRPIMGELNEAIRRMVERGDFILGEEVDRFEQEFAAYCGAAHGVGVDCGLSALELILRAYGIGPGDEVIVPTFTFTATAASVTFAGAKPVFVDVDPLTYCIDVSQVEAAITPRTRAVIAVHFYGQPAEMDELRRVAERNALVVVEDACQAHGASYKDRKTGTLGDAAAFSFYPSKNLGAFGDGGMVVTNDADVADKIRAMRNCGQRKKNVHELAPFNHRLDTLQAAVLRTKLRFLDRWNESRRRTAASYGELLGSCRVVTPASVPETKHVYHLYVIRSSRRDALQAHLHGNGIGSGVHYPKPVHLQPFYAERGYRQGTFPVAERLANEVLSLPMFPFMAEEQMEFVALKIEAFLEEPILAEDQPISSHGMQEAGWAWKARERDGAEALPSDPRTP